MTLAPGCTSLHLNSYVPFCCWWGWHQRLVAYDADDRAAAGTKGRPAAKGVAEQRDQGADCTEAVLLLEVAFYEVASGAGAVAVGGAVLVVQGGGEAASAVSRSASPVQIPAR